MKFLGKRPLKKYVRPIRNSNVPHKVTVIEKPLETLETVGEKTEEVKEEQAENTTDVVNNEIGEANKDMDERLEKVEALMNAKAPKRKVKVEKKDKGIIERTENSTVLLTEDNKMMLTD